VKEKPELEAANGIGAALATPLRPLTTREKELPNG
jgi:hypothetical protein